MRTCITKLMVLAIGLLSIGGGSSAHAAISFANVNSNSQTTYDSSIYANDLINASQSTYLQALATRPAVFGFAGLNNGSSVASDAVTNAFYAQSAMPLSVTFSLNTSANVNGYDITSLQTIAGWAGVNAIQANQKYEVLVRQVGSTAFTSLGTFTNAPFVASDTNSRSTRITLTDSTGVIAKNVDAVRFNIRNPGPSGGTSPGTVYRELDVLGTSSSTAATTKVNLIQNGSFEANTVPANNHVVHSSSLPIANWTTTGTVALVNGQFGTNASDGGKWLSMESTAGSPPTNSGTISQTFATVAGANYELSFDYNVLNWTNNAATPLPWQLTYNLGAGNVTLTLPNNAAASPILSAWETYRIVFTATGPTTTLAFSGFAQVAGYYGAALDNVVVTHVTPEPSSMALVALGALGMFVRRKKR